MLRINIISFLLAYSLISLSQHTINSYDQNGLKHGKWITKPDSILRFNEFSDFDTIKNTVLNFINYSETFNKFYVDKKYKDEVLTYKRSYVHGTLNGDFKYSLGDSLIFMRGVYDSNKINGTLTVRSHSLLPKDTFHDTFSETRVRYQNGIKSGPLVKFNHSYKYSKPNFNHINFFKKEKLHGLQFYFGDQGKIRAIISFKNGEEEDGWYIVNDHYLNTYELLKLKNGNVQKRKKYNSEGVLIFKNGKEVTNNIVRFFDCKCFFRLGKPFVHPDKGILW